MTSSELKEALEKIFSADSELYQSRGFQRRIGYGERPALINIDLANAWTRPGHAFTCDDMDVIIPAVQDLLAASREKSIPIVYTSTAYEVTQGPNTDMGLWHLKIPAEVLQVGTEAVQID
ncbi:MAG: N-carbamoylsarcosine amidase, partial [Alphaproteobacteria bacterium]|nr:N-carbamoylsarcosine amidase [Alphaproteobacteria bacterium]